MNDNANEALAQHYCLYQRHVLPVRHRKAWDMIKRIDIQFSFQFSLAFLASHTLNETTKKHGSKDKMHIELTRVSIVNNEYVKY